MTSLMGSGSVDPDDAAMAGRVSLFGETSAVAAVSAGAELGIAVALEMLGAVVAARRVAASGCAALIDVDPESSLNELIPTQPSVSSATTAADMPSARGGIEGRAGAGGGSGVIFTRITKRGPFGAADFGRVSEVPFDSCACTTLVLSSGRTASNWINLQRQLYNHLRLAAMLERRF